MGRFAEVGDGRARSEVLILLNVGVAPARLPYNGKVADPNVPRDEAEAALHTRKQLGDDFESALVDSFVDRIDQAIESRVAQHLRRANDRRESNKQLARSKEDHALALAIVSLGVAIPLTAIASDSAGVAGILIAWLGIVLVNFVYGLGRFDRF